MIYFKENYNFPRFQSYLCGPNHHHIFILTNSGHFYVSGCPTMVEVIIIQITKLLKIKGVIISVISKTSNQYILMSLGIVRNWPRNLHDCHKSHDF